MRCANCGAPLLSTLASCRYCGARPEGAAIADIAIYDEEHVEPIFLVTADGRFITT